MKKYLTSGMRSMLFSAFVLLSGTNSYASHIYGADLRYSWVSGNTYTIYVALYGDCSSTTGAFQTLPATTPQVCIFNGSTFLSSLQLSLPTPQCGTEITPLCPGDTSDCTSLSYVIPGIKKFVFSAIVTLPTASANWRFVYSGNNGSTSASYSCTGTSGSGTAVPSSAGRTASITNLVPGTTIQLIDTLNNITYHNTNPNLTVAQQTIFCNDQHDEYYPGAVDPDGDSLYITLIPATDGTVACSAVGGAVAYTGTAWPGTPISATEPLEVLADSFSMNNSTGRISFHPDAIQRAIVVYNIQEYRSGSYVGTSQREMTVLVINCAGSFPCLLDSTTLHVPVQLNNNYADIYPNPANDELTIKLNNNSYNSYTVTNTMGQIMMHQQLNATQTTVNIQLLPPGLYYISIKGDEGTIVRKFVKK